MNFNDITIFDETTLSDLFKDIYTNQIILREHIESIISQISERVESINDATMIAPILRDFMESSIKNNETLVKIASIVEKAYERHIKITNDGSDLSDGLIFNNDEIDELKQIFKTQIDNGKATL